MGLYEYYCDGCKDKFEQISPFIDSAQAECPKCHRMSQEKLISQFSVTGQGDQREGTLHGCHGHDHYDKS